MGGEAPQANFAAAFENLVNGEVAFEDEAPAPLLATNFLHIAYRPICRLPGPNKRHLMHYFGVEAEHPAVRTKLLRRYFEHLPRVTGPLKHKLRRTRAIGDLFESRLVHVAKAPATKFIHRLVAETQKADPPNVDTRAQLEAPHSLRFKIEIGMNLK